MGGPSRGAILKVTYDMLDFVPLTLADRERYTAFYSLCPEKCAQYSFFALWGWNETDLAELAWTPELCWIRGHGHREGLLAPIGDWAAVNWEEIFDRYLRPGDCLLDVPEAVIRRFPESLSRKLHMNELRDEWEYLHSVSELIALTGGKYVHKRAHVKTFMSGYNWEYSPLLPEDFPDLLAFQMDWCARRDCEENPLLEAENRAIHRALRLWDLLPMTGALLRVDGAVAGYTIAEELCADTIGIRFEKANSEYTGIYQALNKLFLERQGQNYLWVNREEDMGNKGLRDAKLSYHPLGFVKKYSVAVL
jgi:hypothetical protein